MEHNKFLPEYIAWYLNSDIVKRELERSQTGTRIPNTNQNVLKMIPVASIPLSKQKLIVELFRLHLREKSLYQKLIEEKEQWMKAVSKKIIAETLKEEK